MKPRVLILDENHSVFEEKLLGAVFLVDKDTTSSKEEISKKIEDYDGIIIRSRIPLDEELLLKASRLKFIGRVGAGLENIDLDFTEKKGIKVYNAPEGNRDAVAEHAVGMLLMLLNKLKWVDSEVREGIWKREENRGHELKGKTVGILGYGYMGKAFAQRLQGFEVKVMCYDILPDVGDENAYQVGLTTFFEEVDLLSIHLPLTDETKGIVGQAYLSFFTKSIYIINTARGQCLSLQALNDALDRGKVLGACLDVLEIEKSSFEQVVLDKSDGLIQELLQSDKIVFSPHIAGWTHESKRKLAETVANKILKDFG